MRALRFGPDAEPFKPPVLVPDNPHIIPNRRRLVAISNPPFQQAASRKKPISVDAASR